MSTGYSDPFSLTTSREACQRTIEGLESGDLLKRSSIVKWLNPATLQLSLSEHGCRVVQKVLDVAGGEARAALCHELRGHVLELLYSPHGNHVLQKFVEVMPATAMQFVLDELQCYKGGWATLARHKFGCRIEQRIVEHCPEGMASKLVEKIVQEASILFTHKFGNYVVQSILEHGAKKQRERIIQTLVEDGVAALAQDRVASNVLERALHHCDAGCQQKIVRALVAVPGSLHDTACSRFGAFVVRQILPVVTGTLREEVLSELKGVPQLVDHEGEFPEEVLGA
jgi:hypothetical protein